MNRRGFIAAILAAPLAVVGNFAGNHTATNTITEAELIMFLKATKMGPYRTRCLNGPDAFAFKTFGKLRG